MKRLYKTVLDNESLGALPRQVATAEAIERVEHKLGIPLPKTFKQFAAQVGSASWPADIYSVDALAPYPPDWNRPDYLIAFATDGGGNDWCFDTRKLRKQEYSIVFWDHEEPPDATELEKPGSATPFDEWLQDLVSDKLADGDSDALSERRWRIEAALERNREANIRPSAPSEEDVANVERAIGFRLPKDYVWFTTKHGSTLWPLEILDVLELGRLTEEMKRRFPSARPGIVAFARESDGSFVGFQQNGRPVAVGGQRLKDRSFFDFLERLIEERSRPQTAAEVEVDADSGQRPNVNDDEIPSRIVEDERTNSVWRAVAKAKQFTATVSEDGRIQVSIDDFMGGKRHMFITSDVWATVKQHLEKRKK